jgi:hypothetical protein
MWFQEAGGGMAAPCLLRDLPSPGKTRINLH